MSDVSLTPYDHRAPRAIAERLVITGTLELLTPAHLGNGDAEGITDMPLLLDDVGDKPVPLLTGTSIAGALRGYLLVRAKGYRVGEQVGQSTLANVLLGSVKGDDTGEQSPLIVDDALGVIPKKAALEVRDGVKINYDTHTADDKLKYDIELLPAGTTFTLYLELLLPPDAERAYALRHALAIALSGFSADGAGAGGIALGARRSRGFGRCVVREWSFTEYPLADNVEGLLAWIAAEHSGWTVGPTRTWSGDAAAALGAGESHRLGPDARRRCKITAQFAVAPLLIRSTEPLIPEHELSDDQELHLPDVSHLRSYRPDKDVTAVVPGTSLAGVLRSRATMILNTLAPNHSARTQALIDAVFGFDMHRGSSDEARPTASRLIVEEQALTSGNLMVQNRVAIDRFTGGAFDTALFSEAPWFNGMVNICLTLRHDAISADNGAPHQQIRIEQAQIGLLLLLLKDLWTGDLPLGGGASVGRGRLTGVSADIHIYNEPVRHLQTTEHGFSVDPETVAALEPYVTALHTYLEVA